MQPSRPQNKRFSRYWWPLIVHAHRSENPIEYMRAEMQHEPYDCDITRKDVTWMIRKMSFGEYDKDAFMASMHAIKEQIKHHAKNMSQIQLKSLFIHLATSVTQVMSAYNVATKKHCLNLKHQIVTYVTPNVSEPYIWLHTDIHCKHYVRLVKHTFLTQTINDNRPFKVCIHIGNHSPPTYKVRHLALDLKTGKAIDTSNLGAFLQLALYPQKNSATITRATPAFTCVIVLTHGAVHNDHYELQNIYFNDAGESMEHSKISTLSVSFHSE